MFRHLLRRSQREEGQAIILFAFAFVAFIGLLAMSIDVGRYVWAKSQMQAAVDAAALAGAQSMPNGSAEATTYATTYWTANSGFLRSQGKNVSFTVTFPSGNRAINFTAQADIPTWFAKYFGIPKWRVSGAGRAESQVLDIAVVLDISGSMCFDSYPRTEAGSNIFIMSPGRATPPNGLTFPKLASNITATQTTITLNSAAIFTSTNATYNLNNFGNGWNSSTPYWQRDPDGGSDGSGSSRKGMIMIGNELMKITAVSGNTLTVLRGQVNNNTGVGTAAVAHSAGDEVWAQRNGGANGSAASDYCNGGSRFTASTTVNGPHEPFDSAISNAKYFISLFNQSYDKIGIASYSSTAATRNVLSSNWSTLNSSLDGILFPTGGTNMADAISEGMEILDGSGKRANAVRVLVILTDGVPTNYCSNGYTSASCSTVGDTTPTACPASNTAITHARQQAVIAKNASTIVYTIGLGVGVLDCVLQDVANDGGGEYFKAPTTAELDDAFREIAARTHIALTQ